MTTSSIPARSARTYPIRRVLVALLATATIGLSGHLAALDSGSAAPAFTESHLLHPAASEEILGRQNRGLGAAPDASATPGAHGAGLSDLSGPVLEPNFLFRILR